MAAFLVVLPARDEEEEVGGALRAVAQAAARAGVPVTVVTVRHRCTDGTTGVAQEVASAHPDVSWVAVESDAATLGEARAEGVAAGAAAYPDLQPTQVWVASTDADSRVPEGWLAVQRELADGGVDLVLGTVELRSGVGGCGWRHQIAEEHTTPHGANLGVRLSAYLAAGGFPATGTGEDAALVHAVRDGERPAPWASTDRVRVLTSDRREGHVDGGLARFLRRLDDAVERYEVTEALGQRLREVILELVAERGPGKTICPSEAAGAVDPGRRRELTHVARAVACGLADEGLVVVTQKGVPVDGRTTPGPVRVRQA